MAKRKTVAERMSEGMNKAFLDLQSALKAELTAQGHVLTGRLSDSIQFEIRIEGGKVVGVFIAEDYGLVMETGIPASRIPYGGRTGRGGRSKYIEGLARFFELRGRSPREALSAAFATAAKHKREGLPSRGSFAFTRNGRRTGWIKETLKSKLSAVGAAIGAAIGLGILLDIQDDLELPPLQIPV